MISYSIVQAANGAGEHSGRNWPEGRKPSTTGMDKEFRDWLAYRRNSMPELQHLTATDRKQLRGVFFRGVRQGFGKGNPSMKKMTKASIRERIKRSSAKRRVAVALAKFLKQQNPGRKITAVRLQKLKGGVIKITPVKVAVKRAK